MIKRDDNFQKFEKKDHSLPVFDLLSRPGELGFTSRTVTSSFSLLCLDELDVGCFLKKVRLARYHVMSQEEIDRKTCVMVCWVGLDEQFCY